MTRDLLQAVMYIWVVERLSVALSLSLDVFLSLSLSLSVSLSFSLPLFVSLPSSLVRRSISIVSPLFFLLASVSQSPSAATEIIRGIRSAP